METQKIANLLNDSDNESSKLATRRWYITNDQNNGQYDKGNENDSNIKFETKIIKPNLCDYLDGYILVTGNITATGGNAVTRVAFKNCAPFTRAIAYIIDEHVEIAENLDIRMPMYYLLEYSDNYADSSGSLYQFKRGEQSMNNGNVADVATDDPTLFEYKSIILGNPAANAANANVGIVTHALLRNVKIIVPLKYLSNFFRSLEMPLINFKIHLELNWRNNSVMSTIANTTFKITSTKLYVQIFTLPTEDNVNLKKTAK